MTPGGRHRVFVYGTLRQGGSNHHRMAGADFIAPAVVHARLYRISWYPGLVLDADAGLVRGEIYELDERQLEALDRYEGDDYRRVETGVGDERVWIWEWIGDVHESGWLPGGDWLAADVTGS